MWLVGNAEDLTPEQIRGRQEWKQRRTALKAIKKRWENDLQKFGVEDPTVGITFPRGTEVRKYGVLYVKVCLMICGLGHFSTRW